VSQQPAAARQQQDPSALYRLHARALERKVAARIHTSRQNIEDACSFAWLQLLTHDVSDENVLGWLVVVAANQALRLHQRSLRTDRLPEIEDGEAIELPDPADGVVARERLLDACALLDQARLTERQRRLVGLQAAGYSYKEIAQRTGSSLTTVQRQLLRAHGRIRRAGQGGETPRAAGSSR
jgi:RNA polymerase sigma factor (sigma-70 family)